MRGITQYVDKYLSLQLQKDEETRMKQMLDSLSNASTRKVLMKHLGTANHFGLAGDVVQRLRTLQKLNESGTDSVLICTMSVTLCLHPFKNECMVLDCVILVCNEREQSVNDSFSCMTTDLRRIKAAEEMELGTLRSIREHVQLEKQRENVLVDMERQGMETILKLREVQHRSLMEVIVLLCSLIHPKYFPHCNHLFSIGCSVY